MFPHGGPAAHFPDGKTSSERVRDFSKYLQLISGSQSPDVVGCLLDHPPGPPAGHAVLTTALNLLAEPQIPHLQYGNNNVELTGVCGV